MPVKRRGSVDTCIGTLLAPPGHQQYTLSQCYCSVIITSALVVITLIWMVKYVLVAIPSLGRSLTTTWCSRCELTNQYFSLTLYLCARRQQQRCCESYIVLAGRWRTSFARTLVMPTMSEGRQTVLPHGAEPAHRLSHEAERGRAGNRGSSCLHNFVQRYLPSPACCITLCSRIHKVRQQQHGRSEKAVMSDCMATAPTA